MACYSLPCFLLVSACVVQACLRVTNATRKLVEASLHQLNEIDSNIHATNAAPAEAMTLLLPKTPLEQLIANVREGLAAQRKNLSHEDSEWSMAPKERGTQATRTSVGPPNPESTHFLVTARLTGERDKLRTPSVRPASKSKVAPQPPTRPRRLEGLNAMSKLSEASFHKLNGRTVKIKAKKTPAAVAKPRAVPQETSEAQNATFEEVLGAQLNVVADEDSEGGQAEKQSLFQQSSQTKELGAEATKTIVDRVILAPPKQTGRAIGKRVGPFNLPKKTRAVRVRKPSPPRAPADFKFSHCGYWHMVVDAVTRVMVNGSSSGVHDKHEYKHHGPDACASLCVHQTPACIAFLLETHPNDQRCDYACWCYLYTKPVGAKVEEEMSPHGDLYFAYEHKPYEMELAGAFQRL